MTLIRPVPGERGSVTPLMAGLALVIAGLAAVVVDSSAAFGRRESLDATADAAALAAADALATQSLYETGLGETAPLDPVAAAREVAAALDRAGATVRFPGLTWSVDVAGRTVIVHLTAPLRLPLHVGAVGGRVPVAGSAAAVAVVDGG